MSTYVVLLIADKYPSDSSFEAMELTSLSRSTEYEKDRNGRESIWTFPRHWRVRFFVIFYGLVIGTTSWGTYETIVAIQPNGLNYRSFIVVYVESIAGSVVTSMLIIDLMRSITMLSNAIEDWLIEKRKKREEERQARQAKREQERKAREAKWEEERIAREAKREQERIAREAKRREERKARDERLRAEAVEYGKLVATCEARGEEPPSPPWASNQN